MPLHIDYRPRNFDEVIGNEETIKKLKSKFGGDDCPHVFLFQGPTGCGKTTLGRITKEELKCHKHDFVEINAANNRGIDTAREIIQTVSYKPMAGPTRVILIDEVHKATKDFQTALLKPLEDTPDHAYFILCTTDPEMLLKTVRNRCSIFDVNKLSADQIDELIDWVLKEENLEVDKSAKDLIVESVDGCPRSALIVLDQIIDLPLDGQEKAVQEISIGSKEIIDLCRALIKGDAWPVIAEILRGLKREDCEKVRRSILGYMQSVLLGGGPQAARAALAIDAFREPTYNGGWPLVVLACWESIDPSGRDDIPF